MVCGGNCFLQGQGCLARSSASNSARPAATDDMKSVAYLCCPVQSQEGWSFVTALTTFLKGDWDGVENRRLLPARQLDFNDPTTGSIFKEIHYLGNWIVNFDELLDRRQLLNQGVKVIRYKQGVTQGRNILVSSNAPLNLLRSMVLGRVRDLNLELPDADCDKLTKRFIEDANEISGDIVLRAAKRGRNASELMGVVLSRYLIRHELGTTRRFGWYFLDDYAEWLGQREEQMADVLALSPEQTPGGKLQLAVIVSESKYIDAASVAAKRKESQKQLRDTLRRINDAIFGDPKRLDRDLWLSRFSDLVMNGIQFPANSPIDLAAWRRAVRDGECGIFMRGYSHIFVSGPSDAPDCSDFGVVAEAEHSYQEVFSVLKANKVSNIFDLNKTPNPTERLPFLWVIHDEFAEWMMTAEYADAVSDIVGRLGVKARAAGISLVFAAQRPDANVMPMQLRANLGNRLVLRVDGEGTSEIALGEKGAERLLGKGHLAAKLEGAPDIIYGQVPFVDSDFLSQAVTLLKEGEHSPHSGAFCSP